MAPRSLPGRPTCYFGDAFQLGDGQRDDAPLGRAHPQQPLAEEEAGDPQALLACSGERWGGGGHMRHGTEGPPSHDLRWATSSLQRSNFVFFLEESGNDNNSDNHINTNPE